MIASLLLRLLPFRAWLIGGAVALVLGYIGVLKVDLWTTEHQLVGEKAARAVERDMAKDAAIAAAAKYRELEQDFQHQKEEAERAHQKDIAANARVVADLGRQLVGVRSELAEYASGRREPSGDSIEACQRRASALGDVLGEALRLQDELANDAEVEAANARSVLAAWPTVTKEK